MMLPAKKATQGRVGLSPPTRPAITSDLLGRAAILVVALTALLTLLYPARQSYELSWFLDSTVALEEVIAPENFYVYKNEVDYEAELSTARASVPPVFLLNARVPVERRGAARSLLDDIALVRTSVFADSVKTERLKANHPEIGPISESTLAYLLDEERAPNDRLGQLKQLTGELLAVSYASGLVENRSTIASDTVDSLIILTTTGEEQVAVDDVRDLDQLSFELQTRIAESLSDAPAAQIQASHELVAAFLVPNLTFSGPDTEARRRAAESQVARIKGTVLKGERIIDEHERVTPDHVERLSSLVQHLNQRQQQDPYLPTVQTVGRFVISGIMVAVLFAFLALFRESVYRRTSNLVLFGILMLMPAVVAHYAAQFEFITPFLVPIALSTMLATVLFDAEVGFVVAIATSILCSSILGSLQHSVVFMVTGIVGAFTVRQVLNRSDFYRSIAFLSGAYFLTIAATGVLFFNYATVGEFVDRARWDVVFGIFTSCGAAILAIGLLPIFESTFNVVTSITLLELSDLNRPLLRNLAIRAPGTYSHSIIMSSLSEAAAEGIGADPLLARVGCYYHDIGKMIRPHYFIENQKGINPHDELQPRLSALIIISHVKEGVELAREEGLPRAIIDLIPQHHGTNEIASFKHRALERGDKQTVRDEDFRYPGPKPQTKVAGIINLADAIESATRTIPGGAPDQIKGMVQTIIRGRFTSGELDECDLTLRDLTHIQEAFLPILEATRHARVPYPWQQQQQRTRERRGERGQQPRRERREP